jgi:cysteinyl-tRNA synthetase
MVSDLLQKYSYSSIRLLLLTHHYRTPWEFTIKELDKVDATLTRLKSAISSLSKEKTETSSKLKGQFVSHLENDMDTPSALKGLLQQVKNNPMETSLPEVKELLDLVGITL